MATIVAESGLTRRSLLVWFGGAAAMTAVAGGGLAARSGRLIPGSERTRYLSAVGVSVLAAVADRMLLIGPGKAQETAFFVDASLDFAPPSAATGFDLVLRGLENGLLGFTTRGSSSPFTQLAAAQQDQALLRWRDSRIAVLNLAYHGLRRACVAFYYCKLDAARTIGYPGPLINKPEVADPGRYGQLSATSIGWPT